MTEHGQKPVIVVGGGAAGLLTAAMAAECGRPVLLMERNDRPGRKLRITGKGRCNLTNDCTVGELVAHVPCNGRFLYSAFCRFTPQDMMALMEAQGVPLKVERGSRVFPVSDRAEDVVDALVRLAEGRGVRLCRGRVTELLLKDGACVGVRCEDGTVREAAAVAVCTGGASYPRTGSTGDGYRLARQAGHTVTDPRPSLVPLESVESWPLTAQGLSLKNCALTVTDGKTGKTVYTDFGEMLFTHFGVSGPMILSASAHMREMEPGRYRLRIDLKPALSAEKLEARIGRDRELYANQNLSNALTHLLPHSLVVPVLRLADIPEERKYRDMTREERRRLTATVKALPLTVRGFRPIAEAIITSGGVSVREVDAKTMESKRCRGLYFAGEVLDVDAYTGGFNLQIAFSTAAAAGRALQSATAGE